LTIIDKENGGKADALNAGLNYAHNDLFLAVDVDSILEPDALLRMVKPFIEETKVKVIASGE
jgi:cellulose synthase/poly-beta-1,6-N-acetylglucosamine synthase-like glycosyltransferase